MKFGGIGVPELLIILAVALLIFGPKNLPKLGSALGKTVKNLREGMGGNKAAEEAEDEEVVEEVVEEKPAPKKTTTRTSTPKSSE
ncbi:MAG: twin-arginine translocase TatA/TatE family subunit [Raoultibacter sp.]